MTSLLVCGGRDYTDTRKIDEVIKKVQPTIVIQGGAGGADSLAKYIAEQEGICCATVQHLGVNMVKGQGT